MPPQPSELLSKSLEKSVLFVTLCCEETGLNSPINHDKFGESGKWDEEHSHLSRLFHITGKCLRFILVRYCCILTLALGNYKKSHCLVNKIFLRR